MKSKYPIKYHARVKHSNQAEITRSMFEQLTERGYKEDKPEYSNGQVKRFVLLPAGVYDHIMKDYYAKKYYTHLKRQDSRTKNQV